jgi:hypothetical protein
MRLRAEDDARVFAAGALEELLPKGGAVLREAGEADVVEIERQTQSELRVGGARDVDRDGDDLGADAVTGQNEDAQDEKRLPWLRPRGRRGCGRPF